MPMEGAGLMSGLNEGMNNFLNAYVKMKSLKNQEDEQQQQGLLRNVQIKAAEADLKNKPLQTKIAAQEHGYLFDPESGSIEKDPLAAEKEQRAELAKGFETGGSIEKDPLTGKLSVVYNKDAPGYQLKSAQAQAYQAKAAGGGKGAATGGAPGKLTPGQQTLDRTFAKEYDDWTSGGEATVSKNLQRLEEAKAAIAQGQTGGFLGSPARVSGRLPDILKPESAIRVRQDVQAAAQGALKATLGAQFTEKEGQRIMDMAYDEKLSPQENIRKIDMAINELKTAAKNKAMKAAHFEENGTLTGYKNGMSTQPAEQGLLQPRAAPSAAGEMISVVSPDGAIGQIPRANLEKAIKKGYKVK